MNINYFLTILLIIATCSFQAVPTGEKPRIPGLQHDGDIKIKALAVLETKCNFCHRSQNPGKVFTGDNMERHAKNIYKQVFVKRRMPKGKLVKLTPDDQQALMAWLKTTAPTGD
jgi:uncharacterized membrane protein